MQNLAAKNNSNDPTVLGASIGLYEGKTCAAATPPKKTWQPGGEVTIMDQLAAGLGAGNEYLVAKALESRGVQKKITVSEEFSLYVNNTKREAEAINYLPHPTSNTNSSSVTK
ncbi:hypothetical protein DOM21_09040 [Bacteriovorax stolpii]|uniref:Uncharacterized protein n=1 Tax=Bacteriovorax stolpii TaxID=960 RepID=A0A2K9NSC8_BACTC|nr:hypothetical protein [Bacteriovorax stolpii]AUN98426.1 hypothetical protein C0V70_09975 [Bacteriovorax stolpii]QDK41594.1 hypothetical protein DOM21_09040 [Bacteriovorax stolpii]TDP50951.1 hypothetical protein C8D79_3690 [Bacteriovorax stolpii]